ncbi:hypothetical protein MIMGU_mgv1a0262082mg, partial [Erythranthe guttata]
PDRVISKLETMVTSERESPLLN